MAQGPARLFWRISPEFLAFGAANFLKLGTMMVAGLTLLAPTLAEELFLGLVKFRFPYPGAFAFALALRWCPRYLPRPYGYRRTYILETRLSWRDGLALRVAAVLLAGFIVLHRLNLDLIPVLII
jgi:hypothetical protein